MDITNQRKNGDSVTVSTDRPIVCSAMDRAQAVVANLSPSFLRRLLKSHVTGRFRLVSFEVALQMRKKKKKSVLQIKNHMILALLDENDREYKTNYAAGKTRLTSGWRSFSTAHKLLEGDVLVFQLIEPCKFKIYIVKETRLTQVNGATTTLPNQDFRAEPTEQVKTEPEEENTDPSETTRDKYPHEYDYYSDNSSTEISTCIRSSEYSLLSFTDVKGFNDFSIYVDGMILNSEIPTQCKAKYYELCKSQNKFLHENLVQGLSGKLAAEMISEMIKIADAIRAVDPKTGPDRMESWDKTLKAFKDLGMAVGFLRVRIHELLSLSRENRASIRLKRIERDGVEEEMRALNVKL